MSAPVPIQSLHMRGIVKRFPGVVALNNVSFDVQAGEIHALLGENGAGKSTLMKILYGLYQPEEGQVLINGEPALIHTPHDSIMRGIGMIHQHFMLVPSLTVAENVALGMRSPRGMLLDLKTVSRKLNALSQQYNLKIEPDRPIWQLAVGEQQRAEILRALYKGAALLILDEPTAVLTPQESDELFAVLRQMTLDGKAIIFISHKLHEVLAISQRITVLRDGQLVATISTQGATKLSLAEMMVGRPVTFEYAIAPKEAGEARLTLSGVSALSDRGDLGLDNVSLTVRSGEIVGVAGVSGNGQRELAQVIAGLRPCTGGTISVEAADASGQSPAAVRALGVSYIPEERMIDGVVRSFSVADNFVLKSQAEKPFSRWGLFLRRKTIDAACQTAIDSYEIKTPSTATPIKSLSGGNMQKLILARELADRPRVLIAAQPTRGVDIGASEYIHHRLLAERDHGTAVLLISEDLDEVMALSDRIVVMYEGRIVGEVQRGAYDVKVIGAIMAGADPKMAQSTS